MFTERLFQIALLLSVILHLAILCFQTNFLTSLSIKPERKIEISYVKNFAPRKIPEGQKTGKKEAFIKIPNRIVSGQKSSFSGANKEGPSNGKLGRIVIPDSAISKPRITKPTNLAVKKRVMISPPQSNKIASIPYISHSQIVREKIRRTLYQNYSGSDTGEAYLSFVITRTGDLKDIKIIDEKSTASQYLKEIALKSLKESAPFPTFPKDLDYPELSFNVVVSFEIE
ncbi:MAG: TonB C-terminal domain-containing protein [Candidatus Omnitrophica bacterium]|nr:TonB C-terminal domain-containing protein [Candidatus Omnitrophota bacterium]MBU1869619.1 TonB C-terminal domain-containing protein [Candidatus Omnitrophota bacterium]